MQVVAFVYVCMCSYVNLHVIVLHRPLSGVCLFVCGFLCLCSLVFVCERLCVLGCV